MGQYYLTVNLDKHQFIYPHKFGDGLKLIEFGASGTGTMFALAVLLADGNGRGGGDLNSNDPIVGSWAGDRIVVAGDYADDANWLTKEQIEKFYEDNPDEKERHRKYECGLSLYRYAHDCYEDISVEVMAAIMQSDEHFAERFREAINDSPKEIFTEDELIILGGI